MTDTLSPERRSYVMSRIRSRDTTPERIVRRYLFSRGLRFRVNVSRLPGHPDIVLSKYRAIVEVRGCFWHRHPGCKIATTPKSNVRFWKAKFRRNVARDRRHEEKWAELGWHVFVVWECELRPSAREATLSRLYDGIAASARHAAEPPPGTPAAGDVGGLLAAAEPSSGYDVGKAP